LVPVAAPATDDPEVRHPGMTVDDEVAVGTVLVLAHFCTEERGIPQQRKALAHELAHRALAVSRRIAIAVGWIELSPSRIVGDFEAAMQVARNAVHEAAAGVDPHGQARLDESIVTGRGAEVVDLLPRGLHARANHVREHATEPRSAREDVSVGLKAGAVTQ